MQIWDIHILKIICSLPEIWIDLSVCILSGNLITRDHCLGFTKHLYIHHFFWAKGLEILSTNNGSSSSIGRRMWDFLASQKSHMGTDPTCLWERRQDIVIREKGGSGQRGKRSKAGGRASSGDPSRHDVPGYPECHARKSQLCPVMPPPSWVSRKVENMTELWKP